MAALGYLSVDVPIPRPRGDSWNERTWPFPLIREEIEGSQLENILTSDGYPPDFEDKIVEAGQRLIAKGCVGIITDCGFLAIAQPNLARRLSVPIAASALIQIPSILAILPANQSIGVLTYDATKLGALHLSRVGIHDVNRVHITGAPEAGELKAMVRDKAPYSHEKIEKELINCALELIAQHEDIGTILLECTQMPPFAEAVHRAVRLPVYDIYTMGLWFYSGICNRTPDAWKT